MFFFLTIVTRWSRSTSNFYTRWVHAENSYSILKLACFDTWSWQSFVTICDVFNCLFLLDVQNEIQFLSRVFCYSWLVFLIEFLVAEKCPACQSRKSDFGWHRFRFPPCWIRKRVIKAQAILALLDSFQELHLEMSNYCIYIYFHEVERRLWG